MKKIVIIGGMPRSGTNLARRIIGSHSKIAIPTGEFKFFRQLSNGKSVREILANPRLKEWNVDFSDLYAAQPAKVFIQTLTRYAENVGKEIPGEKTPQNEFFFDLIKEWLKDFDIKFVHLVRNPFDVMASIKHFQAVKNMNKYKFQNFSEHIVNWKRSVSMGLARAYVDPQKYFVLKYEDLASEPSRMTSELCEFIGVDFEEERMLSMTNYEGHKDNTSFPLNGDKQFRPSQGIRKPKSRKDHLSRGEIIRICDGCQELALAMGYKESEFQTQPPETSKGRFLTKLKQWIRAHIFSRISTN
jgi:hypothetical protein